MSEGSDTPTESFADDRLGLWLHRSLGVIAASVMFLLMLVTFVDVIFRYLLNAPIPGAYEITEILMGVMVFAALPVITWGRMHITIDVLDGVTPKGLARGRDFLVTAISAVALAAIAWRMGVLGTSMSSYGEVTEYLRIPKAPIMFVVGGLSGLGAILMAVAFVRDILRLGRANGQAARGGRIAPPR